MKKLKTGTIVKFAVLILMAVVMIMPVYIVVMMGTYRSATLFLGIPITPSNYLAVNVKTVLGRGFIRSLANSVIVSLGSVLLCTTCSSMVGYAIAEYNFRLRKILKTLILVLLMVPTEIAVIGYVREMRTLGIVSTYWPLILTWGANAFCAYFMETFIENGFPKDIMESARIDGCGEFGIFTRLALPIIRPGLVTCAILIFMWSWNSYMLPLIIINKTELYTIPLFVSTLTSSFQQDYGAIMCGLAMAILPIIVVFTIFSKQFMESMTAGAVKG